MSEEIWTLETASEVLNQVLNAQDLSECPPYEAFESAMDYVSELAAKVDSGEIVGDEANEIADVVFKLVGGCLIDAVASGQINQFMDAVSSIS